MSATMVAALAVVAALVLGGAVTWLYRERECSALRSRATLAETRLADEGEALERERALLREQMPAQFQDLARQALDRVSGEQRAQLEGIVKPVTEEFVKFSGAVAALQQQSAQGLGSLKTSLEQLAQMQTNLQEAVRTTNDATGQLRSALQNPRGAGSWGEIGLKSIVEFAGVTEHCDFDSQTGVVSAEGTSERPDMIVKLVGGLRIPVDAKTPVKNFLDAFNAQDDAEREHLLKRSARDLKQRIAELRNRGYDRIDGYAGMTFAFVRIEPMLSSAFSLEPEIVEDALHHGIVVCSPLLLVCYLRAFAHGWSLQKQQENYEEVARRGKTLYHRLRGFFAALNDVGTALRRTVGKFNEAVGKTDNLLVPGRELGKLLGENRELPAVNEVENTVREVREHEGGNGSVPHPELTSGAGAGEA